MDQKLTRYTAADAMLEALQETGVSYLFSNLGSDHPGIIEGLAKAKALNKPLPEVIICPHEFVALSAAHGYYLVSGEAQGVVVHTDVGTQNLGGSLHNAERSRIPVFIFAGETPSTMDGEFFGGRNSHINYLQNVYDQRGIVRQYVKWEYDIRTGTNVKQLVYRAMQLANSDPKGPVYLTGAREMLEQKVNPSLDLSTKWKTEEKVHLPVDGVERIANALSNAHHPVLVTSYLGRNMKSVDQLVQLCEKLAIPVIESNPSHMNFPNDHSLHQGFQGGELLTKADVVLVMDSDVPWVPTLNKPSNNCKVFFVDIDPLKDEIPLWNIFAEAFYRADSYYGLLQLNDYVQRMDVNEDFIQERYERLAREHMEKRREFKKRERLPEDGTITPEWLTTCLRSVIDDETIVINETITNLMAVLQHLPRKKPGTMFINGGTSLGWSGGAALGAKLARPNKSIVHLTGDGSYLCSVPSSVYWMSRKYELPILTVVYNNQGWNATKNNLLRLYPDGIAKRDDRYWVNFDQPANLGKIAEGAGEVFALTVSDPKKLQKALQMGMEAVYEGRPAVIDVQLTRISQQKD